MSFQLRGPGWFAVWTTVVVLALVGFQPSSSRPGGDRAVARLNNAEAIEGEVLLKFRDGRAGANHAAIMAAAEADTIEAVDARGLHRLRSRRLRTPELLALLARDPDVEFAEPNYLVRVLALPTDPSFTSQWGLFNNRLNPVGGGGVAGADIDAPAAWDITTGNRFTVIGVLDTGIDYTHPDLAANVWSAPAPFQVTIGGVTITCAAGTRGFNAVARNCDPMDDYGHGTQVAGTIGARGNNGVGITGVNWIASMMAIKVLGAAGTGTVSDVVAGLEFAVQAKTAFAGAYAGRIRVLSNSWGSAAPSAALQNAISAANDADMLLVTAAGNATSNNDTTPVYPASYTLPNIVSVASSTSSDQRSAFSNYGPTSVDLSAPGAQVLSTVPGNAYGVTSGTSMAAAHVSGAALLALSMCSVDTQELKSLLLDSADRLAPFSGFTVTGGRLNVRSMVENCPRRTVTNVTLTSDLVSPQALGKTVTWTAIADGGEGPYSYRWFVETSPGVWWNSAWESSNTFAWTPTAANASYRVLVGVRSAWNTGVAEFSVTKPYAIHAPVTGVTLYSNAVAPQNQGTTVTWTAYALGGEGPYQYQFAVWDGVAWTVTRPWGASNTYAWTPAVANPDYRVAVQARGAWNPGAVEFQTWKPFAIRDAATSLTLTPGAPAPGAVGKTVTFTAAAAGGQAPYQYRWSIWNGAWTVVVPWSTSASFTWTPTAANSANRVGVEVRSAGNTGAAERVTVVDYAIATSIATATAANVAFEPATTGGQVDFYRLEIFAAGANPASATPAAIRNLGLPVCTGECTVDVSAAVLPLPSGFYVATVAAVGPGGTARSAASPPFYR
jgi:hypothetical protein